MDGTDPPLGTLSVSRVVELARSGAIPGSGHVYFVAPRSHDPIKIGYTGDLAERLRRSRTDSPVELVVLGLAEAHPDVERELHLRFRSCRSHGEWFRATPELMNLVRAYRCATDATVHRMRQWLAHPFAPHAQPRDGDTPYERAVAEARYAGLSLA